MFKFEKTNVFKFEKTDDGVRTASNIPTPIPSGPQAGSLGVLGPLRKVLRLMSQPTESSRTPSFSEPPLWKRQADKVDEILEGLGGGSAEVVADLLTELWEATATTVSHRPEADRALAAVLSRYQPGPDVLGGALEIARLFQTQHQIHAQRAGSMGSFCVDGRRAEQVVEAIDKYLVEPTG